MTLNYKSTFSCFASCQSGAAFWHYWKVVLLAAMLAITIAATGAVLHAGDPGQVIVLNPKSYPLVGGTWAVDLDVLEGGDLSVAAGEATALGRDVEFAGMHGDGGSSMIPSPAGQDLHFEGVAAGKWTLELAVLTDGPHHLLLEMGGQTHYASNTASFADVTSTTANGTYGSGDTIDIRVSFSEAVSLGTFGIRDDGSDGAGGTFEALNNPTSTAITQIGSHHYALVSSWEDAGVQIINITDPASPTAVAHVVDGPVYPELLGPFSIATTQIDDSHYALVAARRDHGVQIIDITNPARPTAAAHVIDGSTYPELRAPYSITTTQIGSSHYALVAAGGDSGVQIINITNPTRPSPVADITDDATYPELRGAVSITTTTIGSHHYALVAALTDDGVQIINITNPARPSPVADITDSTAADPTDYHVLDGAFSITTTQIGSSHYALVAAANNDGVQIINITNPASPSAVAGITNGTDYPVLGGAFSITTTQIGSSHYALVAAYDGDGVQIINITDPASPTPVAGITDGAQFQSLKDAHNVAVAQIGGTHYAFIAGNGDDAVQILDITDPADPADPLLPYIELDLAGDRRATYTGLEEGDKSLVFEYVVREGDMTGDLAYKGTGALKLGQNVLRDADESTDLSSVTLPAPGTANSLSHNKGIVLFDPDAPPPMIDTEPPVITLQGSNPVTIMIYDMYTDAGATCKDNVDASRVLTPSGTVDTSTGGTYVLTYSCTDTAGNMAQVTRTVNVQTPPPIFGSSELDLSTGVLMITFSETIDVTPKTNVDAAKIHIRESGTYTGGVTLTTSELGTTADGKTISFTLTPAHLAAVRVLTTPELTVESGAVQDMFGRPIANTFDVSTARFVDSFLVVQQDDTPSGMAFSNDGAKMFVVGWRGDDVHEYALSVPFDISSTVTNTSSFDVGGQISTPLGMAFSNNGAKMFVVADSGDNVHEYALSVPFDLSSTVTHTSPFYVGGQGTKPSGLVFSNDGAKMFVTDILGKNVNEYALSVPFDLSSTVTHASSFYVGGQDASPVAMAFSNDGAKMFVVGWVDDEIHEYTLSVPFDISSTVTHTGSLDIKRQDTQPVDMAFSNNGAKMFVVGNDGNDINEYTLSSTYPISVTGNILFITTWKTDSANQTITIPATGTYGIDWGDGIVNATVTGTQTHTYATAGSHTVVISGGLTRIHLNDHADAPKLVSIDRWGDASWTTMENAFRGASNMVYNAGDAPDLSGVTDMDSMFEDASSFNGNISSWNVSSVTNISDMFNGASSFNGNISSWDVSSVTHMSGIFNGASDFNGNISSWDVSSVTHMSGIFNGALSFDQNLGNWYVVPADTTYGTSEGTLNVTTISAQNAFLDGHSRSYGIGSGGNSTLFDITDSNTLMFKSAPSAGTYNVVVTASGTDVFSNGNNWRLLEIEVTGQTADTEPPTLSLTGDTSVAISVGTTYNDAGAICEDTVDGPRTPTSSGTVDTSQAGTYTVTYSCTDEAGNTATPVSRTVTVGAFIITWRTATDFDEITLPISGAGMTVHWGDGNTTTGVLAPVDHIYNTAGDYTVQITGGLTGFRLNGAADASKLVSIDQWGTASWASMENAFRGASNMTYNAADSPDLASVTDMSNMFASTLAFNGDLSSWDVSSVTDMSNMFASTLAFNGDLSSWNVSSVTDMSNMFASTLAFNGDLSSWDVSSVTDMSNMFASTLAFNGDLSSWNVSSVTDMSNMFASTLAFNGDLSSWNVSSVTDMSNMFASTLAFNGDLSSWNVSSVTDMASMFDGASFFNQPLNDWDVSKVTAMGFMFRGATDFEQNLGNWYIALEDMFISQADVPGIVGEISAQNRHLNRNTAYGIGTGGNSDLFGIANGNELRMTATVGTESAYKVNITSAASFGTANHRVVDVTVIPAAMFASVTSTTPDGGYGPGDTIDVRVNFTEPVALDVFKILDDEAGGTFEVLDNPTSIAITQIGSHHYALVSSWEDAGVQIINITDPTSPSPVAHVVHGPVYPELLGPFSIATTQIGSSHYALVAGRSDHGVQIIDITNPASPTAAAHVIDGSTYPELRAPYSITTTQIGSSHYALVAAGGDSGVQIINITNPTRPSPVADITDDATYPELGGAVSITTTTIGSHHYALVAAVTDDGVQIINITNPARPSPVADITDSTAADPTDYHVLDGAFSITTTQIGSSHYALVAAGNNNGVQIINITNPASPSVVAGITNGTDYPVLDAARSITTTQIGSSHYALVAAGRSDGVQIINITDPASPTPVAGITDGAQFPSLKGAYNVAVAQIGGTHYAFIAGNGDDAVQILDITDPADPADPLLPYIELDLAGDRRATYTGLEEGGKSLVFEYVVREGDMTGDLAYKGTGALKLGQNVLRNADNAMVIPSVTLPAPGTANSLSHNKGIALIEPDAPPMPDIMPPVITLQGSNPVTIMVDGTYTDAGATCRDNVDASRVLIPSGTVDTSAGGSYVLTYSCTDAAGNMAQVTRTVNVQTPPPIFVSSELDLSTGVLMITFSETIDVTPKTNVSPTKIHIRESGTYTGGVTLTTSELGTTADGDAISFTLTPAHLAAVRVLTTPELTVESGAVQDMFGRPIANTFDVSTARFVDSFLVVQQDDTPSGMAFSNDGAKMFVVGWRGDDVHEYALSVPFDISSTVTHTSSFDVGGQISTPLGMAFSNNGAKMFVVADSGDNVHEYALSVPFDLSSTVTHTSPFYVGGQGTKPSGLVFSNDGAKMFVTDILGKNVNEYALSVPFDLSSTVTHASSFYVGGQDASPVAMAFSNDGAKMFVVGWVDDEIHEYTLSVPFDISSTVTHTSSLDIKRQDTQPVDMAFSNNGAKMFVVGNDGNDINEYTLSSTYPIMVTDPTVGAFVTTWETTTTDESITLPIVGSSMTVNWGDGNTTAASGSVSHTYNTAGDYTVQITGGLTGFRLGGAADASKLVSIDQWGTASWTTMDNAFRGASNMVYNAGDAPDLSGVTDMTRMFDRASSFNGNISSWDVSSVTDMSHMFKRASSFNQPLSSWNVSSVTDMTSMFDRANAFSQNLGTWYVVPVDTAFTITDASLTVTTISAQNSNLNAQISSYGIGSGHNSTLFKMNGTALMFKVAPTEAGAYQVNVMVSGDTYGTDNHRILEILVN